MAMDDGKKGAFLVIGGASLWGVTFLAAKIGALDTPALILTWYVSCFATIVTLCVRHSSPRMLAAYVRRYLFDSFGVALSGMIIGNALLYVALTRLDLTLCSLLERSQPLFVVLLSHFWLKERLGARTTKYCFLALIAAALLVLKDPTTIENQHFDFWGVLAILGTGLSWALSTIFGKRLVDHGIAPSDISVIRFMLATLLLAPVVFALYEPTQFIPNLQLLLVSASIAVLGVGGFLLYYAGLRFVSASRSAFLELSQPLVGVILGVIVFGEGLSWLQASAIPLLLYAVANLTIQPKETSNTKSPKQAR